MAIWYWGSPELPDKVRPVVDKAAEIGKHVIDTSIGLTKKSLEVQAPYNPIARFVLEHGLSKLFEPDTNTQSFSDEEMATTQYGTQHQHTDTIEQ